MTQEDLIIAHTRKNESDILEEKMRVIVHNFAVSKALTLQRKHHPVNYFKNCRWNEVYLVETIVY